MNEDTLKFLRGIYKEFYFKHTHFIELPSHIQEREFGYVPFGGGMVRHISFKNEGELIAEILRQAPSSIYCSNARYDHPTLPMEEKGWKGAELIFDIDADTIMTECKTEHDFWYCKECYTLGKLPKPEKCIKCERRNLSEFHTVCKICLQAAKEHVKRLIDILSYDFDIPMTEINVFFSGNRGYHLHVLDNRFERLDSQARAEIVDYIMCNSVDYKKIASDLLQNYKYNRQIHGWNKRIFQYIQKHLLSNEKPWQKRAIYKLIKEAIENQIALIDPSVTTDIHRIFRLAGTLHGGTGLLKIRVKSLDTFDPQCDPVVLGDSKIEVKVKFCPRLTLKGRGFGPFNNEKVTLPIYMGVYLMCKGLAEVA